MVDTGAASHRRSATISYYFGSNIPGKPRALPAEHGRPPEALRDRAEVVADDYKAFEMSTASTSTGSFRLSRSG